ncbi:ras-related protein RIC1-like isoform X2 [Rhopalosiphum maidis]|uniref:ras-related protein RIC1-like isoform X2 n=1 Tax=Rhopalosiphum maidis TaxID=43146 RepID=UPI000EFE2A67|nr:ras-related protein RIC1-like isoform X2 [Rhopalosiphum maidis]
MGDKLVVAEPADKTGPQQVQRIWKIIVVGDMNIGKTSIIKRYCDGNFIEHYSTTTGLDLKKKTIIYENKTIVLNIWDTAGTEKYQSLMQLYYREVMGLFIVYDVTDLNSLHNLDTWIKNIDDFAPSNVVKILIGNKCDLESNRKISTEEGKLDFVILEDQLMLCGNNNPSKSKCNC